MHDWRLGPPALVRPHVLTQLSNLSSGYCELLAYAIFSASAQAEQPQKCGPLSILAQNPRVRISCPVGDRQGHGDPDMHSICAASVRSSLRKWYERCALPVLQGYRAVRF
jgi:hypothetical protein